MERLPDWHSRYNDFIEKMRQTPFEWGKNDCGPAWAGQVVSVLTGEENPAKEFSGKYKTVRGAVKVMKESNCSDLKELATKTLNVTPTHPSQGYIGDIAVIAAPETPFGYSFGIVNGERVFFRTEKGVGTLDLLECDSVFKL